MSKLSKEIKNYVSCPQTNGQPYGRWGSLNSQQRIKIWNLATECEMWEEMIDNNEKKINEYEKIIGFLKKHLVLAKDESLYGTTTFYTLYFIGEPYETYKSLTKEEYDMLERLMLNG